MAQQILDVSTPNSGLGDALRDASIKSNENFTELYEDKVDKVAGRDLSDNNFTDLYKTKIDELEAQAQVNIQSDWNENDIDADAYIKNKPEQLFASLGYFDYADLATQTTPITVPSNTPTLLTNDADGDSTNESQPPFQVTSLWDTTTNSFDFTELSVGDTVDIRIHTKVTTSTANQNYHIDFQVGIGSPSEFENRIFTRYSKTAGEDEQTFLTSLYIGNSDIRDNLAKLYITSDASATVKVVGWFIRVFRKSVNIVDFITDEAPIDGLTYGRKDAGWVEVSGGGSVGTLEQVTDNGNTTPNPIEVSNYIKASEFRSSADDITFADGSGNPIFFFASTGANQANFSKQYLTADRNYEMPDQDGTIALLSDIPSGGATNLSYTSSPTNGIVNSDTGTDATIPLADGTNAGLLSPSEKTAIGTIVNKEDTANKSTTTADIASSVKFPVWSAVVSYVTGLGYLVASDIVFGTFINGLINKATVTDTDVISISDNADTQKAKKVTFINLWDNYIKVKANSVYQAILTATNFGTFMNSLTVKNTLVDADEVVSDDSADSQKAKKTSWLNVWLNYLKAKTDAQYFTKPASTTGAVISFATPQIYNSVASPTSSNITNDLTGATAGVIQKIYHNNSSTPTFPAGWVKLGSGGYANSTLNVIYAEWVSGSRVEYWITQ